MTETKILRHIYDAPKYRAECPPDMDAYTYTASRMFNVAYNEVTVQQRQLAKMACFGVSPP